MREPIDRTRPPFRDDPVVAVLTDDEFWALAGMLARLAERHAARLAERGDAEPVAGTPSGAVEPS